MKTNKFWFVMTAAVMLTGAISLVSCEKEEPLQNKVVESEVIDQGMDANVKVQTDDNGTTFSYDSWIIVSGYTRSAFENKISVTLNNNLNNVDQEIEVSDWSMGEGKISFTYDVKESRQSDEYVTLTDSVLRCSVAYANFSFDYELVYQVAVYNDGYTIQTMPYHKFENIVDNGYSLSDLEENSENGIIYERKLCTHSITATLNGKSYTASAEIVLKKPADGQDKLIASKVVNEGLSFNKTGEYFGKTTSWIEIEQTWSISGTKRVKKEIVLTDSLLNSYGYGNTSVSSMLDETGLECSAKVVGDDKENGTQVVEEFVITQYVQTVDTYIKEKGTENVLNYFPYKLSYETAVYQDEFITYEMPSYSYSNPQISASVGQWDFFKYYYYAYAVYTFSFSFGPETFIISNDNNLLTYED